jgi:uncharacterized protein YndB with AHSA1/START domain
MTHAERTVTVRRPIQDVYAYVADGANNRRWRSGVLEISRTSGDGGVGTEYHQVLKGPAGRHIPGDYRVTAADPSTLYAFEVIAGPARPTGRFDLAPEAAGGTRVTFALDLEPRGLMKLMAPVVSRQMGAEVASLERLKADLEG